MITLSLSVLHLFIIIVKYNPVYDFDDKVFYINEICINVHRNSIQIKTIFILSSKTIEKIKL